MKFSKKRQKWAQNRQSILKGQPLNYNAALESKYSVSIKKLVQQMTRETKTEIMKLFKSPVAKEYFAQDESIGSQARILMNKLTSKFSELFGYKSSMLAKTMVINAGKSSATTLHRSLKQLSGGISLKTSIITPELEDVSKALIAENVSLIKSIPEQYFKEITGSVMRSISAGGLFDLEPEIQKYEGITSRRAHLIALDQTRKAYTMINKVRLDELGVTHFEWMHTGGSAHPRESHLNIDGMTFSFANLIAEQKAAGVPEKDQGLPAYAPYCRCRMLPVYKLGED